MTAMINVLRSGCPWRALHDFFGPLQTDYSRWRLRCDKGLWERAIRPLSRYRHGVLRHVDASRLKVHQDAHGGVGGKEVQAIGYTRGGSNGKLSEVYMNFILLAVNLDWINSI